MTRRCPDCKNEMANDGLWCWCVTDGCSFWGSVNLQTGKIEREESEEPEMCQACERGECWDCGMQTWCKCDCPGPDGVYL